MIEDIKGWIFIDFIFGFVKSVIFNLGVVFVNIMFSFWSFEFVVYL